MGVWRYYQKHTRFKTRQEDPSECPKGRRRKSVSKGKAKLTQSGRFHNARLASALHRFGWVFGGTIKSTQGGHLRRGRRIPVNALSAGRRRKSVSKGKCCNKYVATFMPFGRPGGSFAFPLLTDFRLLPADDSLGSSCNHLVCF